MANQNTIKAIVQKYLDEANKYYEKSVKAVGESSPIANYWEGRGDVAKEILSRIEKDFEDKSSNEELAKEIEYLSKRYPEVSFAKLSRIAVHVARWQKGKIMKEAKSGVGNNDNYIQLDDGTWIDLDPSAKLKPAFNVEDGEKVKVIVIKED